MGRIQSKAKDGVGWWSRDIQMSEHERFVPDHEDKDFSSDTVSLGGASKAGADTVEEPTVAESPIWLRPRGRGGFRQFSLSSPLKAHPIRSKGRIQVGVENRPRRCRT